MATCPRCGRESVAGTDGQSYCPNCQAPQFDTAAPPPKKRVPASLYLHAPTTWLIAVNVIVFLVTCYFSRSLDISTALLVRFGADFGPLTLGGQPWRLLTATFLHKDVLHIAFNMWALLNLGILAEILFGRRSYFAMYFVCGLASSMASVWWHFHSGDPAVVGVGASGAIFGIAGALIPALALQKNARLRAALSGNLTSIIIFVIYTVAYGVKQSHIDNSAHLGGLAAGLLLGVALPSSPRIDDHEHRPRRFVVFVASAFVLLGLFSWLQKSQGGYLELARGQSAFQKKDFAGAVEHLNKSLAIDPRLYNSHYLLGLIYLEQKKNDEAEKHLLAVTQIVPTFADAHSQLCVAYIRQEELPNALASCKQAASLDPDDPDKQFNLGLMQRANNDLPGAIDSFTKAERLRPNGFDEEAMLGESLVAAGRIDEAIVHLRLANKAKPADQHVRRLLAQLLFNRGDRDEARKVLGR